jgi:hypothetical protein
MDELTIPIFKKAYDLYKTFHGLRNGIPKQDRHALWQRIENTSLSFIEHLFRAGQQSGHAKKTSLEEASVELNILRILLRLARDTKTIDLKKHVFIQQIIDEIGRMLGGWIKSVKTPDSTPPPQREFLREERRKCRTDDDQRLSLRLSFQLLLTLSRPSFQLSSTRLPSAVCTVPLPIHCHCESSNEETLFAVFYLGATPQNMRSISTKKRHGLPSTYIHPSYTLHPHRFADTDERERTAHRGRKP